MICYVLAMGKQHLGPHVVVGYRIKIVWPGLFITSPDHLEAIVMMMMMMMMMIMMMMIMMMMMMMMMIMMMMMMIHVYKAW